MKFQQFLEKADKEIKDKFQEIWLSQKINVEKQIDQKQFIQDDTLQNQQKKKQQKNDVDQVISNDIIQTNQQDKKLLKSQNEKKNKDHSVQKFQEKIKKQKQQKNLPPQDRQQLVDILQSLSTDEYQKIQDNIAQKDIMEWTIDDFLRFKKSVNKLPNYRIKQRINSRYQKKQKRNQIIPTQFKKRNIRKSIQNKKRLCKRKRPPSIQKFTDESSLSDDLTSIDSQLIQILKRIPSKLINMNTSMYQSKRFKWMIEMIQDSFEITSKNFNIQEVLQSEEYYAQLIDFFNGIGPEKIMFYFQNNEQGTPEDSRDLMGEQQFILTSGEDVELKDKAVYFLRITEQGKAINMADLDGDILFGELSPLTLTQLNMMMTCVFQPLIEKMDKGDWGECDEEHRNDFLNQTRIFQKELDESLNSLNSNIDKCKLDQDLLSSKQNEVERNEYFEALFAEWINLFKENFAKDQNEQKKIQNEGPKSELIYWKKVLQDVTLLMELTRTKDFLYVKNALMQKNKKVDDTRTKLLNEYKNIDNILTERINEAKDNVKYLTTLEKFIEPLYSRNPDEIIETLPALMNAIKMIHTISRYYNTSNKMTGLFVKITNQIITKCKQTILKDKTYEEIWDFEPQNLIETFNCCIVLAQKYKMCYESTKRKASELAKSRHWDFDDSVIFNKLDFFVKRLKKLIELFTTIDQFNTLEKHSNLEGMQELTKSFKMILEDFKKKNHNLLEFENIKLEKDYVELMQRIQKLDSDLQRFIDLNFSKLQNINYSLKLLKKFSVILHRDNIRNRLINKYETILQNYGHEIDMIQKVFDEQKTHPPILRNMPPDAGKIIWVRYLFAKLYGPIEEFPPNLINSKEMKKYIDKYNLIGQNLIIYELYFTQSWCNDIDRAKACLQTALFSIKEEGGQKRLKVNFEIDIQKLIREAKALDREGIGSIPESAKIILLQEEKFKYYYFQLDFIRTEYERVVSMIKPIMKNILIPHIQNLDLKLRPGIVTLTWTSMNIENFIQNVRKELERLEQLVVVLTDIIENRIENNLKMIGKIVLVKIPEDQNLMSLDSFVDTQQNYIQEKAEILISKNTEIERSVDDLLQTLIAYDLDPHVDPIDTRAAKLVKQYYFWYYYQALLNATQRSLNLMKDRICGKRKNSKKQKPFFEVSVTLEDGEVRLVPSLEDIQKAINRAATAVLSCSKKMMSWDQIVKDEEQEEQKESYYKIIAQDKEIVKVILLLTGSIQGTKNKIFEFLQSFEEYEWMWNQNIQEEIKKFSSSNPQLQDYENQFKKFIQLENKIGKTIRNKEIGAMCLKTDRLIDALLQKCTEWKNNYAWDLHAKAKDKLLLMTDNIKNFQMRLQKEVKEIDSLGQVMNTIEEIGKEQSEKDLKFKPIFEMYTLLDLYLPGGVVDKEVVENRQLLQKKWENLIQIAEERKNELQKEQGQNLHRLKENISQLTEDVKKLRKNFEEEGPMVRGITPKEASDRLKRFENEYELKKAFYDINKRGEDLFGLRNQKYPMLVKTHDQIQSLNKLYALYNQVNDIVGGWEEEAWSEISPVQIKEWEDNIARFYGACTDLPKALREWQAYKDLKNKIENYKKVLPFISELKQPMIKDRHWQTIVEITKKNLNFAQPDNFYFKEVIEANLMDFEEDIEDIIDSAKKQDKIEKTKNEIKFKWNSQEFIFKQWGIKRLVPILSGGCIEEISEQLEEDISILSGLGAMRHIGPFKDEVFDLQEMLTDIQETLDLWVKVQILWTSLERVFTEGDISMILTTESKKFKKIDKAWVKTIMEKAAEQKLVKVCCQNEIIKSILPNLQEELEECQKQLEKYLEMKRKTFPRFYFVSDPVLLKFLSQGSDPESIQEDFDKLFDAISKVSFERQDKKSSTKMITEIKNVFGQEEEVVKLQNPVICADYIEKWLQKLEQSMQHSIKHIIKQAAIDISNCSYKEGTLDIKKFIDDYPAQVVLMGLQIKWTKLVTEALEKRTSEKNKAVNDAKSEITKIMENLGRICRDKEITRMNRQKIETLVTIMVYLKDVTLTWKFREVNDFEWQKYTRMYWDQTKNNSVIKITDWEAQFMNEYLGVKERLCITPLTDRCYITLAQAMSMHYGGAPAGPAGTGKTETVKDLGRTLGIFVVVINCSPEHRYTDMAKIFKGLCQSGLWGCFDEFNRIDLEVLSVVAMQIESITIAKKAGETEFMFPDEVEKVKLIPTCGYFITMNPGYAGRQELPENLKVLFRGVTMMVPDREVIIRVKLASSGYSQYEELAKKFKVLYNLCEEQLSKQKHYDFGLRNILSVLRTAGNILREDESENPNEALLLMRTLRDMNYSKLVSSDVNLFQDLLQDIFPKITNPGRKCHEKLEKHIQKVMKKNKLMEYNPWIQKIIQLYETVLVRHGCAIVGPTCTGKSTIIKTLLDSLDGMDESKKYIIQRLNPKAFTSQEMYGMKNFAGEWTPGVFSELWRKANEKKENKPYYWIVCDGPVDAIWIENLNTVLDDNKVLTLANGDRLFMLDTVQLLFEVENLNNASPATVSRLGHIYVSSDDLDYKEILYGWINQRTKDDSLTTNSIGNIPLLFNKDDQEKINIVIKTYFEEMEIIEKFEDLVREETIMEMIPALKAKQVMEMFTGIIIQCQQGKYNKKLSQDDYEKIMIFSILWGVAGTYENDERKKMENLLKKKQSTQLPNIKDQESMYDYQINISQRGIEWRIITPEKWKPPKQIQFSRLLMPTLESSRTETLIRYLKHNKSQVLLIGGAGTAKTSSILMYANKFNNNEMLFHRINFSSATQPIQFQTSIESVCETKIRKGFGPKDGKMMTVFIDDLSMPEKNEWNDQVTLEIVRELIEDSGFYRLEKNERGQFKYIENLNFIAAMNHPGGGRNDIPGRLKHHFFIFNMTISDKIGIIFEPILQKIFSPDNFDQKVNDVISRITDASVKVFREIKTTLLPTPSKFHYLFNLRDVSRIFKGMVQVTPETIKKSADIGLKNISPELFLIALWKHECERVFIDKLVNEKDKQTGIDIIQKVCLEQFNDQAKEIEEQIYTNNIVFCDFLQYPLRNETEMDDDQEYEDDDLGDYTRTYEGIQDIDKLRLKCMGLLRKYNRDNPQKRMDLVLFDDALFHLLKISRIIQMARSSALLVGVGGSGKQSLTNFAAEIGGQQTFQIQLTKNYNENQFKEDIKNLFDLAGHKGKPVTFILTDAEIKDENFLEYINMVLSTGEIPGLIPKDEKEIWLGDVRTEYVKKHKDNKEPTALEIYDYFLNRLRDNLHIVLCFSPVGVKFRDRARKFPSLFNECSIDWFLPWPEQALQDVAEQFLCDLKIEATDEVKESLPKWMSNVHVMVNESCEEYYVKMRRQVFVTPKSYLSFLKAYKKLYADKFEELDQAENNYKIGLQKIKEAKEDIEISEKKLKAEEEKLKIKKEEVEKIIVKLNKELAKANKKNEEVSTEKAKIEKEKEIIEKDKAICEQELAKSLPALQKAQQAANQVTAKEIQEIKPVAQQNAHIVMKYVVDAINVVLYQKVRNDIVMLDKPTFATKKQEPHNRIIFFEDSWEKYGKQAFFDPSLAENLQMMAKTENENLINGEILELLEPYTRCAETWLSKSNSINAFNKMGLIHDWIIQIEKFSKETRNIKPKRIALSQQADKLKIATDKLAIAENQLEEIKKKCKVLDDEYKMNNDEKNILEEEARKQKKQLDQANKLINSLQDERERWNKGANEVADFKRRLIGNVGVSTAFISYCGPFNAEFRDSIANDKFIEDLKEKCIPYTNSIYNELTQFLVDEATVGQWNLEGLPKDVLSIQNGIMVESSERYPLMIDPQNQGTQWIKNKFSEINPETGLAYLFVVNINEEKKFRDGLTRCVENGEVLIVEGIESEVDPILDPVLEKKLVKKGRNWKISIGGQLTDYHSGFKLFLTCKLGNPKFSPELSAKTTIINFTVTQTGLEQQLLSVVLSKKQRILEESLNSLLKEVTENKKQLQELDKTLLQKLTTSQKNLLEDTELIEILNLTKTQAKEVQVKLADAEIKTKEINEKRLTFQPVAVRGSVLYFCMIEIASVDWMYNSSLAQFLDLYNSTIDNSPKTALPQKDVENITRALTYNVYRYVNRGLFEKDKITFLLMACFKILITDQKLTVPDFSIFLKGGSSIDKITEVKPKADWITEKIWNNILVLSQHCFANESVPFFKALPLEIKNKIDVWKKWAYEKADPENYPIPEYEERIQNENEIGIFLRLVLIRCLREDRTITSSSQFIQGLLGDRFIEPVTDSMESIHQSSSATQPVLFLLSAGADPTASIDELAKKKKKDLQKVSLGEGQEPKADSLLQEAIETGEWVLLQNCHLGLKFMSQLDNYLLDEEWTSKINPEFRIWMSCEPREGFPLGLLQRAVKVTNEPPKGIKAGIFKTFNTLVNSEFLERIDHPNWKSLTFATSFLHSVVQERRKFGELGWCIPYEYNYSDLEASLEFIEKYLNQLQAVTGITNVNKNFNISFPVLIYMICEIQYGGKITDNLDRELFSAYGEIYFRETILENEALINKIGNFKYFVPKQPEHKNYIDYIEKLPAVDNPEIFGLNANADITFRTKETNEMITTIMKTRPKESASNTGLTREEIIQNRAKLLLGQITYSYPMHKIQSQISKLPGPKTMTEKGMRVPLNIFLFQEIQRMEYVLYLVKKTLNDIIEAVDGQIIMTPQIVDAIDSIFDGKVPSFWLNDTTGAEISWLKPSFPLWIDSLLKRNEQLSSWLNGERPRSFDLGLFFNPQGFLTAMKQEVVRANKTPKPGQKNSVEWSMDNVEYFTTVLSNKQQNDFENGKDLFNDGIYIHGLWLEGCKWGKEGLTDSLEKKMVFPMNIVHCTAVAIYSRRGVDQEKKDSAYNCPVYKYPLRNDRYLIFRILLNFAGLGNDKNKWKLRGVALLCSTEK